MIPGKIEMLVKVQLDWLFNCSASDQGIGSNWGAMVSASMFDVGVWRDTSDPLTLRAVDKARDLERAYYRLGELDQRVLWAWVGPLSIPWVLERVFGELGGIALMVGGKSVLEAAENVRSYKASTMDKNLIARVRYNCIGLKESAALKFYNIIVENN